MNKWFRISVTCGALPLTAGVLTYFIWLLTRWSWLTMAGLFIIYSGMALVLIGTLGLIVFVWKSFKKKESRKKIFFQALTSGFLLLINFPVAAGIILSFMDIQTEYVITVVNESTDEIQSFTVTGDIKPIYFGTIAPNSRVKRRTHIEQDAHLELSGVAISGSGTKNGKRIEGVVDDYVSNGLAGHKTVIINSNGDLRVIDEDRRNSSKGRA